MPFLLLIPLAIVAGAFLGYLLSDNPPVHSKWALLISDGEITSEGGTIAEWKLSAVRETISPFTIDAGFIACDSDNRIVFSKSIPEEIRQKLRNIVG
jgi:hypothetical protein